MRVFRFSITYLMWLFAALLVDHYLPALRGGYGRSNSSTSASCPSCRVSAGPAAQAASPARQLHLVHGESSRAPGAPRLAALQRTAKAPTTRRR